MYRKLFKFAVTIITILTVNLITNKISEYLVNYKFKTHIKTIPFTLLAMGVIVLIFYPLITRTEEWLNTLSANIIKSGRSIGGKYLGLFIMFFICLAVLLYFYARMWYNIDVVRVIFQGKLRSQI